MCEHTDDYFWIELDSYRHNDPLKSVDVVCVPCTLFRPWDIHGAYDVDTSTSFQ